jgi:hypothetical protein
MADLKAPDADPLDDLCWNRLGITDLGEAFELNSRLPFLRIDLP